MATGTWATLPLATATIGPDCWRDATVKNIKVSQNVIQKSDKGTDLGRQLDPLPTLRDNCALQSNVKVHSYMRQTRAVVVKLRENLLDTNEEMKSLIRGKEALEKTLEHIRKDILLCKQSVFIRMSRPSRERSTDGADDLLNTERLTLLRIKRTLEGELRATQKQLQVLASARKRLSDTLQERNRVLDLVTHSVASARPASGRHSVVTPTGRNSTGAYEPPETPEPDPIGPYTPEAAEAVQSASDARVSSAALRREIRDTIDRCQSEQKMAHMTVNNGLTQKVAETVTLTQHLQVNHGENRAAIHRSQRHYDLTEKAQGYSLGPVSYNDLSTRERLNRPLVKVYQRHPGTQLPEAHNLIEGNVGLAQSLRATSRNVALLHLARLRLSDDIRDKRVATGIDSAIVRLRRRRSNYRWVMEGENLQA
uniref:Coiled-coil domain-containing protein 105 n=1 Tax=Ciona intestinalis TaxID=7719 RepID=H2XTH6_CIOIN|nr:coiled-coil domain-containing protein 105 [Ciona intestinalis]|eukprot:XP_002120394.1 coiled-coil domain-containing protein 105 [Ciona intestinalis]